MKSQTSKLSLTFSALFVVVIAPFATGCKTSQSIESSSSVKGAPAAAATPFGVFFDDATGQSATIHVVDSAGRTLAMQDCAVSVIGAPAVGGPSAGSVDCDDEINGIEAKLAYFPITESWRGTVAWAGQSQTVSCFDGEEHFLDCSYIPDVQLPASTNPFGVYFDQSNGKSTAIHLVDSAGTALASQECALSQIGAPSVDGPVSGEIACDLQVNGIEAKLAYFPITESWRGTVAWAGQSQTVSCFNGEEHFLDCSYIPDVQSPADAAPL